MKTAITAFENLQKIFHLNFLRVERIQITLHLYLTRKCQHFDHFSGMSGSSVISGNTSKSSPDSSLTEHLNKSLCKPPRKLSQLSRPTEAPPAPPPRRHSSKPINFLLGSRLSENELLDSPLCATSEAAVQETYMSSFFQTEPLYQQFYTNQILNIGNVQF